MPKASTISWKPLSLDQLQNLMSFLSGLRTRTKCGLDLKNFKMILENGKNTHTSRSVLKAILLNKKKKFEDYI